MQKPRKIFRKSRKKILTDPMKKMQFIESNPLLNQKYSQLWGMFLRQHARQATAEEAQKLIEQTINWGKQKGFI